jgi:hypothetical protein
MFKANLLNNLTQLIDEISEELKWNIKSTSRTNSAAKKFVAFIQKAPINKS